MQWGDTGLNPETWFSWFVYYASGQFPQEPPIFHLQVGFVSSTGKLGLDVTKRKKEKKKNRKANKQIITVSLY